MESGAYLIASNQYGTYCVPVSSRHRVAAATILRGKVWEPRTINFMATNCGAGDIIHAGVYFGDFLPALSRAVHSDALIWAFEPNSENFQCATKTVELSHLANVRLFNSALGAQTETMLLKVRGTDGQASGGVSRLVHTTKPGAGYENVDVVAGDAVVPHNRAISVVQLDVEGFEERALSGLLATIRRCMPVLVLEKMPGEVWLAENILPLGYALQGRVHANWIFASASTRLLGVFMSRAAAERQAARHKKRISDRRRDVRG